MRTEKQKSRYISYLLRLWETVDGEEHIWRASLERPGGETRVSFASMPELIAYLQKVLEESGDFKGLPAGD